MCYIVTTHTLECDVRPLISDGDQLYAEPFAAPAHCGCDPRRDADDVYACDAHGCCTLRSRMAWCHDTENCFEIRELHYYIPAGSARYSKAWRPFPMIEEFLFPEAGLPHVCEMTELLEKTMNKIIVLGRHIRQIRSTVSMLRRILTTMLMERRKRGMSKGDSDRIRELKNAIGEARKVLAGFSKMFHADRLSLQQEWRHYQGWVSITRCLDIEESSVVSLARNCLDGRSREDSMASSATIYEDSFCS